MSEGLYSQKIEIELVKLLYQQINYAIWAEAAAAVALVLALWTSCNHLILICWLVFILFFSGICRQIMAYKYQQFVAKFELSYSKAKLWLIYFTLGVIVSGISWGFAGYVFMMTDDIIRQNFVVFLLIGVTAAANSLYSPRYYPYVIFLPLAFLPFAIFLFRQGGILILLGLLAFIYMGLMLITSYYSYKLLYRTLKLRFENQDLLMDLSKSKMTLEMNSQQQEKLLSLLQGTLDATTDGILVVDNNDVVESYNKRFITLWNIPQFMLDPKHKDTDLINYVKNQLINPDEFVNNIKNIYANKDVESTDELYFKDGTVLERYSHPLRIGNKTVGRVWSFRDVTKKRLLEAELIYKAQHDSLTGLPNRILAYDRISQAIALSLRQNVQIAVLFIDLDRFKYINDSLGHHIGDNLLIQVGNRLKTCVRTNDTVSREGGDEFLIVLISYNSSPNTMTVISKCFEAIKKPFMINNTKIITTMTIGISVFPSGGENAEMLIKNADIAMYRAKALGGNNYQFYTKKLNEKLQKRMNIENKLHDALTKKEFYVVYQPIINFKTKRVVCVEALIRWKSPDLGIVMPLEFIPIAEETGLIGPIGEWVLLTVCKQLKKWQSQGFNALEVAVNISSRQFKHENLFNAIQQVLNKTEIDPKYLSLEITESTIMKDLTKNIKILEKLKKIGINIVIDDFGVGYSSLNYLKKLPASKLKIDKSFIENIPSNSNDCAITLAILALADKLGLQPIAEGIETKEQLEFLLENNCTLIQGFYISLPVEAELCTDLLANIIEL